MSTPIIIGLAWFTEEQWPAYRRLMVDDTDEFYADWETKAEAAIANLKKDGADVRKVPIDLSEFELWCRSTRRPFNSASRASYVQHLLRSEKA